MKKNPKLIFHLNFEDDLVHTLSRLNISDPAGLEYRLKNTGIDQDVAMKVLKSDKIEKIKILRSYLENYYEVNQVKMNMVCEDYRSIWKEKDNLFFEVINNIFSPFNWRYDEYLFLISAFYSKSNWGDSNTLAIKWSRDPQTYYFMQGFELVIARTFETVDQIYETRPIDNWFIWAVAEATAYNIIYTDISLKRVFPKIQEPSTFSYPQLLGPIKDLKMIFDNSNNIEQYIRKAIEHIKKYDLQYLKNPPK